MEEPSPKRARASSPALPESIVAYFDGGSKGNPGDAAGGWCIERPDGVELAYGWHYLGDHHTNNEAEYEGLLRLVQFLRDVEHRGSVLIRGDSKLVIYQVQDLWRCNAEHLQPLRERARDLLSDMCDDEVKITFEHVPRAKNKRADKLANQGMRLKTTVVERLI